MKKSTPLTRSIGIVLALFLLCAGTILSGQVKTAKKVSDDLLATTRVAARKATAAPPLQKIDLTLKGTDNSVALIEALSDGNTDQLLADLKALGLKNASVYGKKINGFLPVNAIQKLEAVKNLVYAEPVYKPLLNSGKAYTNGDKALKADVVRAKRALDGKGIKIGVLSDSYNSLGGAPAGVLNGELPGDGNPNGYLQDVIVLEDVEGESDEGRAMCEIIHDITPAAVMAFHTAFLGTANFAQGIIDLANEGCDVITDDVSYLNEPFFQDGIIAQAVDKVAKEKGVSYYASAGNYDRDSYSSSFRNGGTYTIVNPYDGYEIGKYAMHDFNPGKGVDIFQEIIFAPGDDFTVSFQWSDPFASVCEDCPGAKSDLDIFLALSEDTADILLESVNFNIDGDAVELLGASYSGTDTLRAYIAFGRWIDAPGTNPDPQLVKYINYGTAVPGEYITNSPTARGHANTKHGVGVGAAVWFNTPEFGVTPPRINGFSSAGGVPILFDTKGKKLKSPEIRMNPLFTATDGGNTSFFGFQLNDGDTLPNFFGTSAAAPHAAAVSAQLRQMAGDKANAKTINQMLSSTAIDMDDPITAYFDKGYDRKTGYGLIQSDKAANLMLKHVGIKRLIPYAECSVNPDSIRNWRINNPNPFAVEIVWEVIGTSQKDTLLALPGDNYLVTKTAPHYNLLSVVYQSPYGGHIIKMACSLRQKCSGLKSTGDDLIESGEEPTLVLGTYPNPFESNVNLELYNGDESTIFVKVYSAQGGEVYSQIIEPTQGYSASALDLSGLRKGMYVMKVFTNNGKLNETIKLIKQ